MERNICGKKRQATSGLSDKDVVVLHAGVVNGSVGGQRQPRGMARTSERARLTRTMRTRKRRRRRGRKEREKDGSAIF